MYTHISLVKHRKYKCKTIYIIDPPEAPKTIAVNDMSHVTGNKRDMKESYSSDCLKQNCNSTILSNKHFYPKENVASN